MKFLFLISLYLISLQALYSQSPDTLYLRYALSKGDTIVYKRVITFNYQSRLWEVRDFYMSGQIQMKASYSAFDKFVKEDYQCNYRTNTKEGIYEEWFSNGQKRYEGSFRNGIRNGLCSEWYVNGQKQAEEEWKKGQLDGHVRYWYDNGVLQYDLIFSKGENSDKKTVHYNYLVYLPEEYSSDTLRVWPMILYLHGGSDRGNDLKRLYSSGIPDQIYRGRRFPFIVISPQCPLNTRWETDNWFDPLFKEIVGRYRIDTSRIYLTGYSLGGSGTWYLATMYPDKFAAIAPISGFTSHNAYISRHIGRLKNLPIWAFHGINDLTVQYEETDKLISRLKSRNGDLKFTSEKNVGHWIHWRIYPEKELYDWFLTKKRRYNP